MFDVCLFDLDQTLVRTDDLKDLRESGTNNTSASYKQSVDKQFRSKSSRIIYSAKILAEIRKAIPGVKLGVFTRSPRSYAEAVLNAAYPNFTWDVLVAFEDVKHTKPYGDGIDEAMWSFDYNDISRVVLVGDGDVDIRAAYHAGCVAVLDKSSWGSTRTPDNWRALSRIPDVIIEQPDEILNVLANYEAYLPELERLFSCTDKRIAPARFDRVNRFIHRDAGGDKTAFPIFSCGRSFAGYKSLDCRRSWHKVSESIQSQKNADQFPNEWIVAVRTFIDTRFSNFLFDSGRLTVTVIPHRPGRKARLEGFLNQLCESYKSSSISLGTQLLFAPDLLKFTDGVLSNSNDKLGAAQRVENIRDHLTVNRFDLVKQGGKVLVIDDVCTSGASLIFARKYLEEAGAVEVSCLAFATSIGEVLYG